ncbi:WD40 repeat domain-containing protein [Streptomyces violascens]|uniref:hypothetical protein n=1 Tax=Streptomyces violascens TaxID=67381 RepID=UPI003656891B
METVGYGLSAIDTATGRTRTVVDGEQILVSGDRTTVAVCQNKGDQKQGTDESVTTLRRISDGTPVLARPYHEAKKCQMDAIDTTGRRIVTRENPTSPRVTLVDLSRDTAAQAGEPYGGTVVSQGEEPYGVTSDSPDLATIGDRLLLIGHDASQIAFTDLTTDAVRNDVLQQVLTPDGNETLSVPLQLRAAASGRLLAEASLPPASWDPRNIDAPALSRNGLFAVQMDENQVSVREVSTLRQTAHITTAVPPRESQWGDPSPLACYFDHAGHLITVSGTQIEQWDTQTGKRLAHFDTAIFHPQTSTKGIPEVFVAPYPAANQAAVVVWGDPLIRVVDLTTGRITTSFKTTTDAIAIQFDDSGRYFALLRSGSVVELWRRSPLGKELGPLRSLTNHIRSPLASVSPDTTSGRFVAEFLDSDGHFLIAANNTIQIYQVGKHAYVDSYDFGHPAGSSTDKPYTFLSTSSDGKAVLYSDPAGVSRVLRLDPAQWERDLCRITGYRTFTADERSSLPLPIPSQPVCAGNHEHSS